MTAKALHIAPGLDLPLEAVTQTFGILARKRVGKSNTAVVMAEEMYDAGLPWVAIDPKGDWWGIRAAGDGKGPGLSVVVFGGEHGDVPLDPLAGKMIADLLVDQRLTCVLDVSEMFITSKAATQRFLTDFAAQLYARNREPLHVFCEEADEYIPQMVRGDDAKMVSAFERLVKRGGFRGIGITLISQRSASLNNDVLTQVDTLMALQTTGPPDKEAIRKWVVSHELGADVIKDLPDLQKGEGWVFSPGWLQILKKVHFRRRRTFDSGATPEVGVKARPPATLAAVDIEKLRVKMEATIEKAKAEDPVELRKAIAARDRKIRDLERQTPAAATREKVVEKRIEVPVVADAQVARLETAIQRARGVVDGILKAAADITEAVNRAKFATHQPPALRVSPPTMSRNTQPRPAPRPVRSELVDSGDFRPGGGSQRILNVLAWLESVGVPEAEKGQVAALADLAPRAGTFSTYLSRLQSAGLIERRGQVLVLTEVGRAAADPQSAPQTTEDLHRQVFQKLGGGMERILRELVALEGAPLSKQELAERTNLTANAGTFSTYLSRLRSLGFIEVTREQVRAAAVLFLEPVR